MSDRPKKKKPTDYPQFAFRLNKPSEKTRLMSDIKATLKKMNSDLETDDRRFTKSEVIVKALSIGLKRLRSSK